VQPPEGVVRAGDDWRYAEWAEGGFLESIGVEGQSITPALAVKPLLNLTQEESSSQ
jgi:penicillin-binding protein 1A